MSFWPGMFLKTLPLYPNHTEIKRVTVLLHKENQTLTDLPMTTAAAVRRTKAFLRRKPLMFHLCRREEHKPEGSEVTCRVCGSWTSVMPTVLSLDGVLELGGISAFSELGTLRNSTTVSVARHFDTLSHQQHFRMCCES